jgi:hypothetical protein
LANWSSTRAGKPTFGWATTAKKRTLSAGLAWDMTQTLHRGNEGTNRRIPALDENRAVNSPLRAEGEAIRRHRPAL